MIEERRLSATSNISLAQRAWNIRRKALKMGQVQGQGYIGQALGISDVLAAAYFHALEYRPEDPDWEGRDRFLLSIGHYAIALYAVLMEAGILPEVELETYGMDDSRMPMSGMASYTPGMEITGRSLGQGLGIAIGMALELKRKGNPAFVYNPMSDGELGEGSTWEAAMSGAHHKLDNLICLVDFNNQQADDASTRVLSAEPVTDKFAAFGWHVQRVEGNGPRRRGGGVRCGPRGRRAETARDHLRHHHVQGRAFLETREITHFVRVEADEWDKALAVLDQGRPA